VLYIFCAQENCADGEYPTSGLLMDSSGNLYGVTTKGGGADVGTIFELTPDGAETVLYSFCTKKNCTDGDTPNAVLIADKKGNLSGTTTTGGKLGNGTVFELAPDGTETMLHSFAGGNDGADPTADGDGTVFEITK
jgi:uncharacterized repeat protein (TIGR03803 family)